MRIGLSLPNNQGVVEIADLVELARAAEEAGVASVWVSEHLFHTGYVAERLGDAPYHEALVVLTAVAGGTSRVRLGTSVLVLPWHQPVRLAKVVASLDAMSAGRVTLGVGVGVAKDEYENLGVPFTQRGAITDDMIRAMKALWADGAPEYSGAFASFKGLRFEPKPAQRPHPPVYIGGSSRRALERVAALGDGWHPLSPSIQDVREGKAVLGRLCNEHGRDLGSVEIVPRLVTGIMHEPWDRPIVARRTLRGTKDEIRAMIDGYRDLGIEELVIDANTADLELTRSVMGTIVDECVR